MIDYAQVIELPAWFYSVFFPLLAGALGFLFGWKLTRGNGSVIFRRKKR